MYFLHMKYSFFVLLSCGKIYVIAVIYFLMQEILRDFKQKKPFFSICNLKKHTVAVNIFYIL